MTENQLPAPVAAACPFCGAGEPEVEFINSSTWCFQRCKSCGATGPRVCAGHGGDSLGAWNRRALAHPAALSGGDSEPAPHRTAVETIGGGVQIKPLEWREEPIPPTYECLASTGVGLYCIPLGRASFVLRLRDKHTLGEFDTLEAAKAAAQSDFESRIRSALAPPPGEPVHGVTEAAQALVDFAWSAVVTDCTESAEYLNSLVDNLRAALAGSSHP